MPILISASPSCFTSGKVEWPYFTQHQASQGTPEILEALAFFLSGRSGPACIPGREWACSWGQRACRQPHTREGLSHTSPAPSRRGTLMGDEGEKLLWQNPTKSAVSVSRSFQQVILVQLCDGVQQEICGLDSKDPSCHQLNSIILNAGRSGPGRTGLCWREMR